MQNEWCSYTSFLRGEKPPPREVRLTYDETVRTVLPLVHAEYRQKSIFDPSSPAYLGDEPLTAEQLLRSQETPSSYEAHPILLQHPYWVMEVLNVSPVGIYNGQGSVTSKHTEKNSLFTTPTETHAELLAETLAHRAYQTYCTLQKDITFGPNQPFHMIYIGDANGTTRNLTTQMILHKYPGLGRVLENVVIDIGKSSLERQKERAIPTVPERFLHHTVTNLASIPDRSLTGIVYAYELLDDLSATLIGSKPDGTLYEGRFVWEEPYYKGIPGIIHAPYDFSNSPYRLNELLFRTFSYDHLVDREIPGAKTCTFPVSKQIPMAMAEINRVLKGGSVLFGDYCDLFVSVPSEYNAQTAMRFVLGQPLRGIDNVDFLADAGWINLTADVDPFAVWRMSRWFDWNPGYFGSYGHYMARHIQTISHDQVRDASQRYQSLIHAVVGLKQDQTLPFGDVYREWMTAINTGTSNWEPPEWFSRFITFNTQMKQLAVFSYGNWAMEMNVPLHRTY